jgi:sulfur-oxidizing protein SoxB
MGGLTYTIAPAKTMGQRISNIRASGKPLDPTKKYKACGWASVREVDGPPVFDVVASYLRSNKRVKLDPRPRVTVV